MDRWIYGREVKGERVYVDNHSRAAAIERLRKIVDTDCGKDKDAVNKQIDARMDEYRSTPMRSNTTSAN